MDVGNHTPVLLLKVKMSLVLLNKKDNWGPKLLDISHVPSNFTD